MQMIERYTLYTNGIGPSVSGEYVKYKDHNDVKNKLENRIHFLVSELEEAEAEIQYLRDRYT